MPSKSVLLTIIFCLSAVPTDARISLVQVEGIPQEDSLGRADDIQKGWIEDTVPVQEESYELQNPVTEVTFSPRRQLQTQNQKSHKESPLTPVSATSAKDIKDETATTGENAKKHLPQAGGQEVPQTPNLMFADQTVYNLYY